MATFQPPSSNQNGKKSGKVPVCPNHGEPLEGLPVPLTPKGTGMCPISGYSFDYEISLEESDMTYTKDHNGNLHAEPGYKVIGEEKGVIE